MKYLVIDATGTRVAYGDSGELVTRWSKRVWAEKGISVEHVVYDETFPDYQRRNLANRIRSAQSELERLKSVYGDKFSEVGACITWGSQIAELEALVATVGTPFRQLTNKALWFHEMQWKHYQLEVQRMAKRNLMAVSREVLADVDMFLATEQDTLTRYLADNPSTAEVFALAS